MSDAGKRDIVSFKYNKDSDYNFATIILLTKAAYSNDGKINLFDPGYKDVMRVTLPGVLSNKKLMRQVLISTNQTFPALA